MEKTVYIGADVSSPDYTFTDESIVSVNINTSVDLLQNEMQIDTAELNVLYDGASLKDLPWETPVFIYMGEDFLGKFYATRVKRVGLKQYEISAVSYIGFLDNEKFYGGVYDGVRLPEVIEQIVKTDGLRTMNALASIKIDRPDSDGQIRGQNGDTWFDMESKTGDMRNGLYTRFRFNGFHNEDLVSSTTTWYAPLCGFTCRTTAESSVKDTQYGVYGLFTRASTSDPFPDTTELFFCYMQQTISIGTPNIGDVIEIECIPTENKVTINGVGHSITPRSGHVYTTINMIGGGRFHHSATSLTDYDHHVNLEVLDYKITDYATGDLILDFLPLLDTRRNIVYFRSGKYGGQFPIPCSDPANVVFRDEEAPGTFPHDYRKDFVDSIVYSPEAKNYRVYGWIPICTKREAIHQILMPSGLSLKKDDEGNWMFGETPDGVISEINTEHIFDGGSIEYSGDVNEIILKEHYFEDTSNSTIEEIFSVKDESEEPFVAEFSKQPAKITYFAYWPEEGWIFDGANFLYAWCENAALIPGNLLKIEGYPYKHQEKVYTKRTESGTGSTVSVEDVTTVTPENSKMTFQRLENYYLKSHTCRFDIVKDQEKCGLKYSFQNPFYEADSGFMVSCGEDLSSFSRAQCEFLCGFDPIPIETGYSNYVILTGAGTWTVPDIVFELKEPKIRVVLIGGGQGGESGCAGEDGVSTAYNVFPTPRNKGGAAGNPGSGGKILDIVIENPSASYTYSSGIGGAGAETTTSTGVHNTGANGGESVFTDGVERFSSDDGESDPAGHVNFLTGERYASVFKLPGWKEPRDSTYNYGDGGLSGHCTGTTLSNVAEAWAQDTYLHARSSEQLDVNWWRGGFWGTPYPDSFTTHSDFTKGCGCGGGAGLGEWGTSGGNASSSKAGNGGNGGNATWIPPKATDYNSKYYGYGGHGGGGGGAGGSSGYLKSGTRGTGGKGGYGGCGGDGGDGCILIYY